MSKQHRNVDPQERLTKEIRELWEAVRRLETIRAFTWIVKDTTGAPTITGKAGMFVENTVDTTLHIWVDGAWRQVFP